MKKKLVALAKQLLRSVPQDEMTDLIRILNYYNSRFAEHQRVQAMENGSQHPADEQFEQDVMESLQKSLGSQGSYITSGQGVCRCCGK
jgi:hypothetical protein